MKRRSRYIDKRLDWRDPNMPILDGDTIKTPEQFQRERQRFLNASLTATGDRHFPHWSHDPTYDLRKKK